MVILIWENCETREKQKWKDIMAENCPELKKDRGSQDLENTQYFKQEE